MKTTQSFFVIVVMVTRLSDTEVYGCNVVVKFVKAKIPTEKLRSNLAEKKIVITTIIDIGFIRLILPRPRNYLRITNEKRIRRAKKPTFFSFIFRSHCVFNHEKIIIRHSAYDFYGF